MSEARFDVIETRLDRIEAICEQTATNIDALTHSIDTLTHSIEALTHQTGLLTEGQTVFRAELKELKAIVNEQSETSKRQEKHIDRLVGIVETLIHRAS